MTKEFFQQVPPDEWKKLREDGMGAEYDANELKHAHGLDHELTGDRLLAIVDEKKKQELTQIAKIFATASQKINQKIDQPPEERTISSEELTEIRNAVNTLEKTLKLDSKIAPPRIK